VIGRTRVAGVDGCPSGWIAVIAPVRPPGDVEIIVTSRFADVLALLDAGEIVAIGVDMPIGLPPDGRARRADVDVRRALRPRSAVVFPTPARPLLAHDSYEEANRQAKLAYGRGLSRQTFNLFPKIRELDVLLGPQHAGTVAEIHPELAFTRLAGHVLSSKHTAAGRVDRLGVLRPLFGFPDRPPRGARSDDLLDALAVAWSAGRFARDEHETFGGDPDEDGRPMRIVV